MVGLPYPVIIEPGALGGLEDVVRGAGPGNRIVVVTDTNVAKRFGSRVARRLGAVTLTIAPGEKHKNRKTWATLTDRMLAARLGRDTTLVAVGGGVVGDIAGFVAATFMRGIPFVQVPTTLMAMVDASVGGKTGVDTRHGKNLVGAFHQPAAVVIDPDVLATLSPDHLRAGYAEVIKHGVVADAAYFERVRAFGPQLGRRRGGDDLTGIVRHSVGIKASIVSRDERESGLRKVLNFGHTIGHAVEAARKYRVLHGHAVAVGMVVESRIAERLSIAAAGTAASVEDACRAAGLPTAPKGVTPAGLIRFTRSDKKARGGRTEYALPARIGTMAGGESGWSVPVEETIVREVLSNFA